METLIDQQIIEPGYSPEFCKWLCDTLMILAPGVDDARDLAISLSMP